jgi:Zn-finger protein
MHFYRQVDQGIGRINDPRLRKYFIYKCNICSCENDIDWIKNFDITRLRKCSNCGVIDDTNNREFLIKRQQQIEQKNKELQIEIQNNENELKLIISKLVYLD